MTQFVVLGMHRSGTTLLTRVLDALGCYTGPVAAFDPGGTDHPKGYWEYRDVWRIDEDALALLDATWDDPVDVDLGRLPVESRAELDRRVRAVVEELDAHRPWAIKDPRLCLLLPLWRPALSRPVCVFIHRGPLEVAASLRRRDGSPLLAGFALWELYNRAAIENARGLPTVVVSHRQLLATPEVAIRELARAIERIDAPLPGSVAEAARQVRTDLHHERGEREREEEFLSEPQRRLLELLRSGNLEAAALPPLSNATRDTLRQYGEASRTVQSLHRHVQEIATRNDELERLRAAEARHHGAVREVMAASLAEAAALAALWGELEAVAAAALPAAAVVEQGPAAAPGRVSEPSPVERHDQLIREFERWSERSRQLARRAAELPPG